MSDRRKRETRDKRERARAERSDAARIRDERRDLDEVTRPPVRRSPAP
jgi:hypothetical protein